MQVVRHEGSDWPRCDACGIPSYAERVTVTFTKSGEGAEAICDRCQGYVEAGMLRPEVVDGELRYRRWFPEWKPGDLVVRVQDAAGV